MGVGLSPVRGFYCQAQRLANVFTEYLLSLFVKYLQAIDIVRLLLEKFGGLKKIRKGVTLQNFFLQVLCFFMEGTKKWTPKFGPVAKLDFSGSAGHERTAEL